MYIPNENASDALLGRYRENVPLHIMQVCTYKNIRFKIYHYIIIKTGFLIQMHFFSNVPNT
jgi:hypothetical protein